MIVKMLRAATGVLLLLPVLMFSGQGHSQGLPEGVKATVIAEYPSDVPGLEMVRFVKVVLEPGAGWKNLDQRNEEYCWLTQGTMTHSDDESGATNVYGVGSRWSPRKGHTYTVTNTGDVDTVMWVYQLVEKGAAGAGKM